MKIMISIHDITQIVCDRIKTTSSLRSLQHSCISCCDVPCRAAIPPIQNTHIPNAHAMTPHPRPRSRFTVPRTRRYRVKTSTDTYAQPSQHSTSHNPTSGTSWPPDMTLDPQWVSSLASNSGLRGFCTGIRKAQDAARTPLLPCLLRPGTEGPSFSAGTRQGH
jgi:hypothetical protein